MKGRSYWNMRFSASGRFGSRKSGRYWRMSLSRSAGRTRGWFGLGGRGWNISFGF